MGVLGNLDNYGRNRIWDQVTRERENNGTVNG